jgi:hypothetical protein
MHTAASYLPQPEMQCMLLAHLLRAAHARPPAGTARCHPGAQHTAFPHTQLDGRGASGVDAMARLGNMMMMTQVDGVRRSSAASPGTQEQQARSQRCAKAATNSRARSNHTVDVRRMAVW